MNKKLKFDREDEQNNQRVKKYNKIIEYLEDDLLGPGLSDITRPNPETKLPELEMIEQQIYKKLKRGRKAQMVQNGFEGALKIIEGFLVQLFDAKHMINASDRIVARMGEGLQKDLRMVSIELSDDWVPGPFVNIGLSLFGEFQREFSNCGPVSGPSGVVPNTNST